MKNNENTFAVAMTTLTTLVNSGDMESKEFADALTAFSAACALSVLKRVIDPQGSRKNVVKASIPACGVENCRYKCDNCKTRSKNNGPSNSGFNPALVSMRRELKKALKSLEAIRPGGTQIVNALIGDDLGDGIDLAQEASAAILEEIQKQREREPGREIDFERAYKLRRLKRRVYNRVDETSAMFETVETTPIQEIYRAIRRAIASSRAMAADPRNGYSYIEDVLTDPESGEDVNIYRRLPKYADLGGAVCDFNGKETEYTTAQEDANRAAYIMAALDLTDRQRQFLTWRIQGYGYRAIAQKAGVTQRAVVCVLEAIQKKAEKIGFTPGMYAEMSAC